MQTAIEDTAANRGFIQAWIDKWYASALNAVEALSSLYEGKPGVTAAAFISRCRFPN
jgi:hypothetical protein